MAGTTHTPARVEVEDLTDKQRAFVLEYVKDHNATQAAIRAGYAPGNAPRQGSDLKRHPKVRAAIQQVEDHMADELGMTRRWALDRLRDVVIAGLRPVPLTYQGGVVTQACFDPTCHRDDCDGDGDTTHEILVAADLGTAHQAVKTLMQHRGMLDKRQTIEIDEVVRYELRGGIEIKDLT